MFETLFLNPANMVVGGALISSPIIIHLINRMRFRRIRWAAMEFLLKSQKRNRRRLIIEQLILLALRILLVLLAGLLLARFLGFSFAGFQARNTVHVVILDDRLSMEDRWKNEDGEVKNSFLIGKRIIGTELAKTIVQARTPQRLVLVRLSEPTVRVFDRLLNEDSLKELAGDRGDGGELAQLEGPTASHLDMVKGVEAAGEILGSNPQDERFLHIVSDLRQQHWSEPEASGLLKALQTMSQSGVSVHLLDTAHPFRSEVQKTPRAHDNLAIVELRPETRVAAEGMPVQFAVTVANFSPSERKNVRVTVRVDGVERPEGSRTFLSVPPGRTSQTFEVGFVRMGHNVLTAQLEDEEEGLQSDNLRYTVIEVRRQVPVLLIDGDPSAADKPGGDSFHVRMVLTSTRGYDIVRGNLSDLERPNLDQYPSIYLLNVREFNDKALKNLEAYVHAGGGVAFFLGDRVNGAHYRDKLYAGGKGIFPAPIADQPTRALTDEEKQDKQLQRLLEPRLQAYIRMENHPIFAETYKFRQVLTFLNVDRYFPVPRLRWKREEGRVEELVTLPNERPVADYQAFAQEILDSLPVEDPQFEKFRPALERHRRAIRDTLTGKSLHPLASALEALLQDPREANDAYKDQARLPEFWELQDEKVQALRTRVDRFREVAQYGDPLVIASRQGRGRVVAFLTTAGKKWTDWPGGSPAAVSYPMVMVDLQKYLTAADTETDKVVGEALELERSSARYEARLRGVFLEAQGTWPAQPAKEKDDAPRTEEGKDLGEALGTVSGERLTFSFDKTKKPGVYKLKLTQRTDMGGEPKTEEVAYAVNVDTTHESDLRRTSWDDLEKIGKVHALGDNSLAALVDSKRDLSEWALLYLLILIILVAEQAMAVHLSFHLRGSEGPLPPQAIRPRATAA